MAKCFSCGVESDRGTQRACRLCHAKYMREWRKINPLKPDQRLKMNARCYARVYQVRGKLIQQDCEDCGSKDSQKHHEDYSKPLDVIWLCRPCHLNRHREEAKSSAQETVE